MAEASSPGDDHCPESASRSADHRAPSPPMARDKRGRRVAPAPDGRGMPEQREPPSPHRLRRFWIFSRSPGGELAVGYRDAARFAAARRGPVQPVLPEPGPGRPGDVDLVEGRHDQRRLRQRRPVPAGRRRGGLLHPVAGPRSDRASNWTMAFLGHGTPQRAITARQMFVRRALESQAAVISAAGSSEPASNSTTT